MAELSRVILAGVGWNDTRLHEFSVHGRRIGIPDPGWPEERPLFDERKVTVGEGLGEVLTQFDYANDFGDDWMHTVSVEAIHEPPELNRRPYCIADANSCPPKDVGGPHSCMSFPEALLDAGHPEHAACGTGMADRSTLRVSISTLQLAGSE